MREAINQGIPGRPPPVQPLKTLMESTGDASSAKRIPIRGAQATGPSSVGTMGIIMPIYSIVIMLFFIFTMFKLITSKEGADMQSERRSKLANLLSEKKNIGRINQINLSQDNTNCTPTFSRCHYRRSSYPPT